MSTIFDRAVRALHPVLGEHGGLIDPTGPLAYCCPPGCRHTTCAVVHALNRAGLLAYTDQAPADSGRHQDGFDPYQATYEEARCYSHGYRDGHTAPNPNREDQQ